MERVTGIGGVFFKAHDLDWMLARLTGAGVQVDERIEECDYGRFAWAANPEGNRFELWEPPPVGP